MSEILLVNPRRRRRAGSRKRTPRSRRKANPRKRRTTRRRSRARRRNPGYALSNPRRRKRRSSRRRSNPAPRLSARSIQANVMAALPGAFGALGLDVALGYLPLPTFLRTGFMAYATKAVGAIGLGMLANMSGLVRGATAAKMTEGALTVMFHGMLRQGMSQYAPAVQMGMYIPGGSGMGYYGAGWNPDIPFDTAGNGVGYLPELSAADSLSPDFLGGFGAYANAAGDF